MYIYKERYIQVIFVCAKKIIEPESKNFIHTKMILTTSNLIISNYNKIIYEEHYDKKKFCKHFAYHLTLICVFIYVSLIHSGMKV